MKILLWENRNAKGYSLIRLAQETCISKSTLNNIENEKVSPTLQQLELIAKVLGVKITDLFESTYK